MTWEALDDAFRWVCQDCQCSGAIITRGERGLSVLAHVLDQHADQNPRCRGKNFAVFELTDQYGRATRN